MTDASQPRLARGKTLPVGILATALIALLAFAPIASAAPDPVVSGKTTITLNGGFTNYLKTFGITVQKISPAKLKGKAATLTVTGGSLDPLTGLGEVTLGGGLKFKAGKKTAPVKGLVLNTAKKSLTGKVAGKKMKIASVAGWSFARNGFGVNLAIKKLKLTGSAAKALNKKTGYEKGKPKPFLGNKLIGKSASETQPGTVNVLPGGVMSLATNADTIGKLKDVEVKIPVSAPTTEPSAGVFNFPIVGGTVGPTGTAGVVQSAGGLQLLQKLPTSPTTALETEITLGNVYADLAAKTLTVEVIAKSNASSSLNLGNLGRASIADITVPGVVADPATRTVTVSNAPAVLQPIAAEVLEGFVKVFQAYYQGGLEAMAVPKETAEKMAAERVAKDHITAGAPLGSISFTAQTQ